MSAEAPQRSVPGVAHAAVIAAAFVALMAWTWGTWPDAIVDFGRELYVPWRMSEGEWLHRDIAWFNGPLSPHWNAFLFETFGVGLATLVWANAVLFACSLALLHFVLRRATSAGAATMACLLVIATCGFGQHVGIGNYNQLAPYSHEATHGLFLALASLALLTAWSGRFAPAIGSVFIIPSFNPSSIGKATKTGFGDCDLTDRDGFNPSSIGKATKTYTMVWHDSFFLRFQSFFYWKSHKNKPRVRTRTRGKHVSILLLLEKPQKPCGWMFPRCLTVWFSILLLLEKPQKQIQRQQAKRQQYCFNPSSIGKATKTDRDKSKVKYLLRFNPSSIGKATKTFDGANAKLYHTEFQSFFYWKSHKNTYFPANI